MKKTISGIMVTLLLMTVLMAIAPAEGQINESSKIRFKAFAAGKCFIGYGQGLGLPDPASWGGIGQGVVGVSGNAEAWWSLYIEPYGDVYVSESIRVRGSVSLSWKEDGCKHRLLAVLYSDASTAGIFVPDVDYFAMGGPDVPCLRFRGIHASGSEIQRISGIAVFGVWPLGYGADLSECPPDHKVGVDMRLLDEDSQTLYVAAWVPEETEIPGPFLVPAAKVFQSNAKVVSYP